MVCTHCNTRPIGTKTGALCSACIKYRTRHAELPPPAVLAKRHDRDADHAAARSTRPIPGVDATGTNTRRRARVLHRS